MNENQITELISQIRSLVEANSDLTVEDALKQSYCIDYPVEQPPYNHVGDLELRASRVLGNPIYVTAPMVVGGAGFNPIPGYCFFNDEVVFRYIDSQRIHVTAIYRLVLDVAANTYSTNIVERLSAIKQWLYDAQIVVVNGRTKPLWRVDFVMSPEQLSCLIDWHTESTRRASEALLSADIIEFSRFLREIRSMQATIKHRMRRNVVRHPGLNNYGHGPEPLQRFEPLRSPDSPDLNYTANTYSSVGGEICPGLVRGFDSLEDARDCAFDIEKINKNTISIDDEPFDWLASVSESSELIQLQNEQWLLKTDGLPQRFSGNTLGDHVASGVLNISSPSKVAWNPHEELVSGFKMITVPVGTYLVVKHHEGCENTPEGRRQAISRLKGMSYMVYLDVLRNLYSDYSILAIRDKFSSVTHSVTEDDTVPTAHISARPIEFIESAPDPMTSMKRNKREI